MRVAIQRTLRLDEFRKLVGNMDNNNGLPYESVPPLQIRIEYEYIPYKELFIYTVYLHFANFNFRKHMNKQAQV